MSSFRLIGWRIYTGRGDLNKEYGIEKSIEMELTPGKLNI